MTFTEYFTFNQDGYLIGDGTTANDPIEVLGIPAGTVIAEGRYSVPVQVEWEASG